jgi:hypothetical protein
MASILPQNVDYTDKDFDSLRLRVQALIKSVFPDWTDFQVSNFGNVLTEMFCWLTDVLCFYQDNQAAEGRIVTATQRRNLLALVKLLDYVPKGLGAATTFASFHADDAPAGTVTIPAGTIAKTASAEDPVEFQLLSAITLPSGSTAAVLGEVENSKNQSETFASNGLPNQEIQLGQTPFLDGSLSLSAANGAYSAVSDFLSSTPTDRHLVIVVDNNDRASIRFGNGVNGQIPSGTITATYKTGGGTVGNVAANSIVLIDGSFADSLANPVTVSVTNLFAAIGGANRETEAQIKASAPASIRAPSRTVAREDYEIHARSVAGVDRALMLTRNEDPSIAENTGFLYIVPTGLGTLTSELIDKVHDVNTVTYPHPPTFDLQIKKATYLDVSVSAKVYLKKGAIGSTVKAAIIAALRTYFSPTLADGSDNPTIDFGRNLLLSGGPAGVLPLSDLFNAVRDVDGVFKIGPNDADFLVAAESVDLEAVTTTPIISASHVDIPIAAKEFPRLKSLGGGVYDVTLINGETGSPLA